MSVKALGLEIPSVIRHKEGKRVRVDACDSSLPSLPSLFGVFRVHAQPKVRDEGTDLQ